MFKRANKTTALLLAAAAVISLAPATGANAAAKRLGVKDGTVKEGIAYDNNKYGYYGFRTDDDLTGIYYNNGGDAKDTSDSDLEDYRFDTLSKYGTKYAYAHEQSNEDEYLIDLSTGKKVDDETKEEKLNKAEDELVSKVKKADRYNQTDDKTDLNLASFEQILQGQFGEVWYKYGAYSDKVDSSKTTTTKAAAATIGYSIPSEATVKAAIKDYEVAILDGKTPDAYTVTVGTHKLTYKATGTAGFTSYADILSYAKGLVTGELFSAVGGVQYDETTVTTAPGTKIETTGQAPLFTQKAVVSEDGTFVGLQTKATGDLEDLTGLTKQDLGTIEDTQKDLGTAYSNGAASKTTTSDQVYYGFANEDGNKYVDASYYANMKVFSQTKGRAVLVEKYDDENQDAELTVHLDALDAVAQDKDNIYAIATVTVTGDGVPAGHATQHYLQKISKAQGEKEDGAWTPKNTTSYLLDEGIYKEGDLQKAYKIITGDACEGADEHPYLLGMTIKGSDLYVTRASEDNVKVYKFNLKSSYKSDVVAGKNLKTDVDTPAVVWDDKKDEDINEFSVKDAAEDEGIQGITPVKESGDSNAEQIELFNQKLWRHPSVSIDINGNTWSVKKNTITKFDGLDKKADIYSVDGDFDAIDVYDDNSLIAWDTDGDHYTTVKEGTAVTEGDGINVNPDINKDKFKNGYDATEKKFYKDGKVVTGDWASDATGKWYLLGTDGTALTGWQQKNGQGAWYYLDPTTGAMVTDWKEINGVWYYLNPVNSAGNMLSGWFQDTTGTWYYADSNGHMLKDTTVDGYVLGSNGAWVQ